MKRIIAAIVGGVLIPVVYLFIAGGIDELFPQFDLGTMYVNGNPEPGLLFVPMALPIYLNSVLRSHGYIGLAFSLDNPWFRGTSFILFDFVLYSFLSYAILRKLGWFAAKEKIES